METDIWHSSYKNHPQTIHFCRHNLLDIDNLLYSIHLVSMYAPQTAAHLTIASYVHTQACSSFFTPVYTHVHTNNVHLDLLECSWHTLIFIVEACCWCFLLHMQCLLTHLILIAVISMNCREWLLLVVTWFKDPGICKSRINYSIAYPKPQKKGILHSTWLPLLSLNQVKTKIIIMPFAWTIYP